MKVLKANYGIDGPAAIRKTLLIGILLYVVGLVVLPRFTAGAWIIYLDATLVYTGIFLIIEALLMIWYGKYGKLKHRDRLLALYNFSGKEKVLDIGAGRGLMAVGAAKKLQLGQVTAIDLWRAKDLTENSKDAILINARLEKVENKIRVIKTSILNSGLPTAGFNLILSNRALSRIHEASKRVEACQEILRLLEVGGVAIISDFKYMPHYMKIFHTLGCSLEKEGTFLFSTFPALTVIKVTKTAKVKGSE